MTEWTSEYLNYSALKAAVYKAEKQALQARLAAESGRGDDDGETGGLLANADGLQDDTEALGGGVGTSLGVGTSNGPPKSGSATADRLSSAFKASCDAELSKIVKFYAEKEEEMFAELDAVNEEIQQVEDEQAFGDVGDYSDDGESGESGDEEQGIIKRSSKFIKNALTGGSQPISLGRTRTGEDEELGTSYSRTRRRSVSVGRSAPQSGHDRRRSQGSQASSNESGQQQGMGDSAVTQSSGRTGSSRAQLPEEALIEIDKQVDRTVAAAVPAVQVSNMSSTRPLPTPATVSSQSLQPSRGRKRASSFEGAQSIEPPTASDIWNSNSRRAMDMRITYKLRLQQVFRELSQLKEYVNLNQSECTIFESERVGC